jgi:3',5'-cyclic AMP phosphodiesterase CpdA
VRTIAHISDLHFGRHDPAVVELLFEALEQARPHLVVVSGDLTQRARTVQFREADAFLRRIELAGMPLVVVPGNHDIPLYDVFRRFLFPLGRYARIVSRGRSAIFQDDELAVLGLNSARSFTRKDGRLNEEQIAGIEHAFADRGAETIRIVVTHHPLVPLPGKQRVEDAAENAEAALAVAQRAHVHLLLAGHNHQSFVDIAPAKISTDPGVLVVQAGTATSTRRRGEANSFNLLKIAPGTLDVEVWQSAGAPFGVAAMHHFALDKAGWRRIEPAVAHVALSS